MQTAKRILLQTIAELTDDNIARFICVGSGQLEAILTDQNP